MKFREIKTYIFYIQSISPLLINFNFLKYENVKREASTIYAETLFVVKPTLPGTVAL
jgi:hypothetical protein